MEKTMDLIKTIEEQQKKKNPAPFKVGDTVKVHFEIIEGKINDDIEDFADSDQALLFAFMKLQGYARINICPLFSYTYDI